MLQHTETPGFMAFCKRKELRQTAPELWGAAAHLFELQGPAAANCGRCIDQLRVQKHSASVSGEPACRLIPQSK